MQKQYFYPLFAMCFAAATQLRGGALPAVTATIEQTTQKVGASPVVTDSTFYRDSQGRTRLETASRAYILDPLSGTAITLDLDRKVARVSYLPRAASSARQNNAAPQSQTSVASNGKVLKPYVDGAADLGSSVIDGNTVIGERHSTAYPPGVSGSIRFQRVTTESWRSVDLMLPVRTTVDDSLNGKSVTYYKNIAVNPSLDPGLFELPNGFRVIDTK